jgi:DNA-binding CsgD family transcriptional regulator
MATSQRAPIANASFQCPICGAWEANGGCKEAGKCVAAITAIEKELTCETVSALVGESATKNARVLEAGFDALSFLHIGLVLCAADGRVLGVNKIAEKILAGRDGLELTRDGMLRTTQESERSLERLIQQAGKRARNGQSLNDVLAVRRGARKRPLTLFIRASLMAGAASTAESSVLIMIMDPALPVRAIEGELRQLYGFSSMEARLANLLIQGYSLEECCHELAFRRSTGCTHLKRLFKKTGVHRQSELVTLLLKSIGLICLGSSVKHPESLPTEDSTVQRVVRSQTSALRAL